MQVKKPFEEVYEENYSRIYKSVYLRVLCREDTEDIVQDTFIKAMSAYAQYDPEKAAIITWLMRIATNTMTDHFRQKQKIVTFPIEEAAEQGGEDTELNALTDNYAREMYLIMKELDKESRELISMRYGQDLSYKEIAKRLDSNEKAVAKRMERLLEKCRKIAEKNNLNFS